jgi:hypothetical protein
MTARVRVSSKEVVIRRRALLPRTGDEPRVTVRLWQWRCTGCDTVEVAWPRHAQALRRALHHATHAHPSGASSTPRR